VAVGRGRGQTEQCSAVQCRWRDRGNVLIDRRAGYCTGTDETRGSSERFRVRSQWCWVIMGEIRAVSAGATAQESLDSSCFRTEDARLSTLSCHLATGLAGKGSGRGLGAPKKRIRYKLIGNRGNGDR
jgi:hypothetical protein